MADNANISCIIASQNKASYGSRNRALFSVWDDWNAASYVRAAVKKVQFFNVLQWGNVSKVVILIYSQPLNSELI